MERFLKIRKSQYDGKNSKHCFLLGDNSVGQSVFKYMTLENAEKCISGSSLFFQEPSNWYDKYESYFYTANFKNITMQKGCPPPKVFASCCTYKRNSEAAWRAYMPLRPKNNKQVFCVRFEFNKVRLRKLIDEAIESNYSGQFCFYEGKIEYKNNFFFSRVIDKYDRNNGQLVLEHKEYFPEVFELSHYLRLLLLKRKSFEYEKELRFFLVPQTAPTYTSMPFVILGLLSAVNSITINGTMSEAQQNAFKKLVQKSDPSFNVDLNIIFNYDIYTDGFNYRNKVKISDNNYRK